MDHEAQPVPSRPARTSAWVILAALGVFLFGLPALLAIPAPGTLFNPQAYEDALRAESAYAQFQALVGDLVRLGGDKILFGSGTRMLEALERSNYRQVVEQIFPESWVQQQADSLIDQFWAFFNFEQDEFQLVVDLRPIKTRLGGDTAPQVAQAILSGLPACSADELLDFALRSLSGEIAGLPLCRPPEQLAGLAKLLVEGILRGAAGTMPSEIDLAALPRFSGSIASDVLGVAGLEGAGQRLFGLYRFLRLAAPALPWLALLCLGMLVYAARNTLPGPIYWGGAALLLTGVPALIIALLLGYWASAVTDPTLLAAQASELPALRALLAGMFGQVMAGYTRTVALLALAVIVIGAGLVGYWWWRANRFRVEKLQ